jgi:hypothetical protein
MRRRSGHRYGKQLGQESLVYVAPAPIFARLKRLHDGMFRLVEMLCGMFVFRGIAAAHVTAAKTLPQMDPGIAHLQAFLTAPAAGVYLVDCS